MRAFQQLRVGKRTTIYQPADWRRIMRKFAGCQESVLGLSWWHLVACNVFGINTRSFYPRNIDGWVLRTVKRALTIHVRTGVRLSRIVLQPSLTSRLYKTQHTDRQTIINAYICNIDDDSIKVPCPLLDKLRFWYRVTGRAFSHLWTKCEILIRYRN